MFGVYKQTSIISEKSDHICRRKLVAQFVNLDDACKYVENLSDPFVHKDYVLGYQFKYRKGINTSATFMYVYVGWELDQKYMNIDYTIG